MYIYIYICLYGCVSTYASQFLIFRTSVSLAKIEVASLCNNSIEVLNIVSFNAAGIGNFHHSITPLSWQCCVNAHIMTAHTEACNTVLDHSVFKNHAPNSVTVISVKFNHFKKESSSTPKRNGNS
jgi:hypothetical protein